MRSSSGACGSESPNSHAPRVNAAHQRWCPGFSRQAWLPECRFVLDTDAADGHGYIALEPQRGASAEHAGRTTKSPCPARKRCTPTCSSSLSVKNPLPTSINYHSGRFATSARNLSHHPNLVHAQNTRASSLLPNDMGWYLSNRTSRASLPRQMSCSLQLETAPCLVARYQLAEAFSVAAHARLARLCSRRFILPQN